MVDVLIVWRIICKNEKEGLIIYERMLAEKERLTKEIEVLQKRLQQLPDGKLVYAIMVSIDSGIKAMDIRRNTFPNGIGNWQNSWQRKSM